MATASFEPLPRREKLHTHITSLLARRVIQADRERGRQPVVFPKEADLCQQLGVSRSILRESMKVLVDKGMVQMKPRAGTWARPRAEWRLLDPDILTWQAEANPDPQFLRDLCEVRLAIEPTAAGFAAVRATPEELRAIERSLESRRRQAHPERSIELDLDFHTSVVDASHNPLLRQLSSIIQAPFRTALALAAQFPSNVELGLEAHEQLLEALRRHDPMAARRAAEQAVGLAMLAVEKVIRSKKNRADHGQEENAPGK